MNAPVAQAHYDMGCAAGRRGPEPDEVDNNEEHSLTRIEAALLAINESVHPAADYSQHLVAAKCRGLLRGYEARWGKVADQFKVISVEETISSDLWNPETGKKSRTFSIAGKLDVRATRGGRNVIVDHKTCSEDIADPNATYWRQMTIEAQPSHYMLLEWLNGRKIDEVVWDVIRKPGISPKKLSKKDAAAFMSDVDGAFIYCGLAIPHNEVSQFMRDQEYRETLSMYEARLAWDCTEERPDWYFQRRTIPRLDMELQEYAVELWEDGQELLHVRNTKRHRRNPGACMNYGRPCRYLGICSGHSDIDGPEWTRKAQVHSELDVPGDGKGIMTYSRIKCFQECRRKHYYAYELGLERVDEDEAESLYFGNLWHSSQEVWWMFDQQKEKYGNDATGSPVIEVGQSSANQPAIA